MVQAARPKGSWHTSAPSRTSENQKKGQKWNIFSIKLVPFQERSGPGLGPQKPALLEALLSAGDDVSPQRWQSSIFRNTWLKLSLIWVVFRVIWGEKVNTWFIAYYCMAGNRSDARFYYFREGWKSGKKKKKESFKTHHTVSTEMCSHPSTAVTWELGFSEQEWGITLFTFD